MLSYLRAGHVSQGSFGGDEGTDGSELVAGVGAGGGQLGSSAWAWRSLTPDQPSGTRVSPRGEARDYAGRWKVAAGGGTRSGDGGPQDQPSPKKTDTEGFRIHIPAPTIFFGAPTRSMCSINPSPNRYPFMDRLSKAVCLRLS
jgi:hypothetical protein